MLDLFQISRYPIFIQSSKAVNVKKWFWTIGLLIVGTLLGGKAAIVSDTRLVSYMTIGAISGFCIGSFLDRQEKKRKRERESRTGHDPQLPL
jgi:hypothetical protein